MSYNKGIINFDNLVGCEELKRSIKIVLKQSKQLVVVDIARRNQQKFFGFVLQDFQFEKALSFVITVRC